MNTQNKVTDSIIGTYAIDNRFLTYLTISDINLFFGYYTLGTIKRERKDFLAVAAADQPKEKFFYNDVFFNRVPIDFSKLTKISDYTRLSFNEIQSLHIND